MKIVKSTDPLSGFCVYYMHENSSDGRLFLEPRGLSVKILPHTVRWTLLISQDSAVMFLSTVDKFRHEFYNFCYIR